MEMSKSHGSRNFSLPFQPWLYFFIFFMANLLLCYFNLSLQIKLWIGIFGLLLPLFLACAACPTAQTKEEPILFTEFLSAPRIQFTIVIGILAIFIRFYRLTTLSGWPLMDEGVSGFESMNLSENHSWRFFYSAAQIPPLYVWLMGVFFKLMPPSLESLWFFPAFISLLSIPISFFSFKSFFSRSTAWIGTILFALSFWPFYLGRYSMPHGLLVLWELLAFMSLGFFLKAQTEKEEKKIAFLLGCVLGTGFYTEFHWPLLAIFIIGIASLKRKRLPSKKFHVLIYFLIPFLVILIPLGIAAIQEKMGHYLSMLWAFHPGSDALSQLKISWEYFQGIFWGVETSRHGYKPFWGGYLNPILDSLFCLGLIELYRFRKTVFSLCIFAGLFLFMLPGLLTKELELFRVILILPPLLLVSLWGLAVLLQTIIWKNRNLILCGLLIGSASLDFYHLLGPYQQSCHSDYQTFNAYSRSFERWKAYEFLKKTNDDKGPGFIFTEFESSTFNQTLTLAVYPFNAAVNPKLPPENVHWAGFLTNINYAPFLSGRFPSIQWFELTPPAFESQEVLILGIVSLEKPEIRMVMNHWLSIDRVFLPLTNETLNFSFNESHQKVIESLKKMEPLTNGDPFLKSILEEKIYYNAMTASDVSLCFGALKKALTEGYPAAHLYNNLGVLWYTLGDYAKARECFKASLRSPLNHTVALENLRRIPSS